MFLKRKPQNVLREMGANKPKKADKKETDFESVVNVLLGTK